MRKKLIWLFILLGIMTGCVKASLEPTEYVQSTNQLTTVQPEEAIGTDIQTATIASSLTPTPTKTHIVTSTPFFLPTPTIELTPTDILPTPSFNDSLVADSFIFTPSIDPDCKLPCWQGLQIGVSNQEDIQRVLDEVFGFNGTLDFFSNNPFEGDDLRGYGIQIIPELYVTGYKWRWLPNESLEIFLWVDENSSTLQAIRFSWVSAGSFNEPSPEIILKNLGKPDYIMVSDPMVKRAGGRTDKVSTRLMIVYEEGIAFRIPVFQVRIKSEEGVNGLEYYGEFCFEDDEASYHGEASIMEPLSGNLDNLTPLQDMFIGRWIEHSAWELVPFEDIYDATLEEATELALQEECVRTSEVSTP
jgi:hypothetical protein